MGRRPEFSGPRNNGNPRPVEPGRDATHALSPWAQSLLDHMVEAYGVGHISRSLSGAKTRREGRGLVTTIERLLHGGKANAETVRRMEEMLERYR